MLKWVKRIGLGFLALLVTIPVIGYPYEQWSRMKAARDFLPSGEIVEFDGANSHLYCLGEGSPTVILEAGGGGGSADWVTVQNTISALTRVCSYDRAGHLWSDERDGSRDANQISDELHGLLESSAESGPYVLVGHSIGGPFAMVFAHRYKNEVVGLVLIDPTSPDIYEHIPEGMPPSPFPIVAAMAWKIASEVGISRLMFSLLNDGAPQQIQETRRALYPQSTNGFLGVVMVLKETLKQAGEIEHYGDLPLVVLTSTMIPNGVPEELGTKVQEILPTLNARLATLSTNSDHRIISGASHYIHWDKPQAVVMAVQDVVVGVREGTAITTR